MMDDLLEHVVEEIQSAAYLRLAFPVKVQSYKYVCFSCFALYDGDSFRTAYLFYGFFPSGIAAEPYAFCTEIFRQLEVCVAVSYHKRCCQVVTAVKVFSEHPCAGFSGWKIIFRKKEKSPKMHQSFLVILYCF